VLVLDLVGGLSVVRALSSSEIGKIEHENDENDVSDFEGYPRRSATRDFSSRSSPTEALIL
jgi:hypothetical protein